MSILRRIIGWVKTFFSRNGFERVLLILILASLFVIISKLNTLESDVDYLRRRIINVSGMVDDLDSSIQDVGSNVEQILWNF